MRAKRLVYYLLLNVVVSAATMLVVLFLWQWMNDGGNTPNLSGLFVAQTPTPVSLNEIIEPQDGAGDQINTPALGSYVIEEGDTLEEIAATTGLTVDEILALNGLQSGDNLEPGSVILLPQNSGAQQISEPNTADDADGQENSEVSPAPQSGDGMVTIDIVVAAGDLNEEYVEIRGSGDDPISLQNWSLQDENGNTFVFPEMTMYGSGSIRIYTRVGNSNPLKLYWGQSSAIWESGESVTLLDDTGTVQSVYTVP